MARAPALLFSLLVMCLSVGAAAAQSAYDRPLHTDIVLAAPEPASTGVPIRITCFYYAAFMVKVIAGDKEPNMENAGAIVPGSNPTCKEHNRDERSTGWGPFVGAKGSFVFFDGGSPGDHGDRGFIITDASGRMVLLDWKIGQFQSIRLVPEGFVLTYRRMLPHHCSLYFGRSTECWSGIKTLTGLTDASVPECRDAYENVRHLIRKNRWDYLGDAARLPAAVSYDVETRYEGGKLSSVPRPGPTACWPEY